MPVESCHNFVGGMGHPLKAEAIDMEDLVHYISNCTDLTVVNRTALDGLFAVDSEGWSVKLRSTFSSSCVISRASKAYTRVGSEFTGSFRIAGHSRI